MILLSHIRTTPHQTIPTRTTPHQDSSPLGQFPISTIPHQDISPLGQFATRKIPHYDNFPLLRSSVFLFWHPKYHDINLRTQQKVITKLNKVKFPQYNSPLAQFLTRTSCHRDNSPPGQLPTRTIPHKDNSPLQFPIAEIIRIRFLTSKVSRH